MQKLLLVQLKKLFLRTDVKWILGLFALLPFGIAFLISVESGIVQIGNSVFSAMGYSSVVVGLLSSLLLISVTVSLTVTSMVSKEIDVGLDCVYITKVKSRGNLLVSKMIAMDGMILSVFFLLILSSVLGWLVFLKDSVFGSDLIWSTDGDETFALVYTFIGCLLETLVMARVYTLFSLLFRYGKALVFNFVIIVIFKLLANMEALRLWIPSYIGSGMHLSQYRGEALVQYGVFGIGLLMVYTVILSVVNYWIYQKMDLSR